MPPARGRGRGRGRAANPKNNGPATDNARNKNESVTSKSTDKATIEKTVESTKEAEEKNDVAMTTTVDTTKEGTSVTVKAPEETTKEVTDIVADTADIVAKERDGDSKDTSEERSKDENAKSTQENGKDDAMETTEKVTEGEFEDIIKEIDTFEAMAKLNEVAAEVSNIADEEVNATTESEVNPELVGDAVTKKGFTIEITKTDNLEPLKPYQIEDMLRNHDWRLKKYKVKLPVGDMSTTPFVEQLIHLKSSIASYSFRMRDGLPIFGSGFLVFNTCEERAKAVTFLTPIIQKIGARLQMKSYFRPTAAMANVSASGDNCLRLNNVPENTTSKQLKALFPQAREIGMPVTKSGKSLGYALLYFKSKIASEVVLMNHKEVKIGSSVLSLQKKNMSTELPTDIAEDMDKSH